MLQQFLISNKFRFMKVWIFPHLWEIFMSMPLFLCIWHLNDLTLMLVAYMRSQYLFVLHRDHLGLWDPLLWFQCVSWSSHAGCTLPYNSISSLGSWGGDQGTGSLLLTDQCQCCLARVRCHIRVWPRHALPVFQALAQLCTLSWSHHPSCGVFQHVTHWAASTSANVTPPSWISLFLETWESNFFFSVITQCLGFCYSNTH